MIQWAQLIGKKRTYNQHEFFVCRVLGAICVEGKKKLVLSWIDLQLIWVSLMLIWLDLLEILRNFFDWLSDAWKSLFKKKKQKQFGKRMRW